MRAGDIKIGEGFDIHRLVEGRELLIGGVSVPHEKGLDGHSDADVLLHAICDALLGALGADDIGTHFPDDDPKWRGADSSQFILYALDLVFAQNYIISNVDATVYAQRPRLRPYIDQIKTRLSELLNLDKNLINVKAKTTERLGAIGREEGIAASVSVLLLRRNKL
ncbi:MAG: 2-C-methyl-D-erythritol 2,4-cyclodiphosphate synthase [Burkholderiales bacterium]